MIMAEIEKLKRVIAQQMCAIVDGVNAELDKRNIGGDSYQATMVLDEVKRRMLLCSINSAILPKRERKK